MFLSKKLLIDQWNPEVIEYFSSASASATSSTRSLANPIFVGTNKVYYTQGSNLRYVNISDAANTQTNVATDNGFFFAEGDSSSSTQVFYSYNQTSSNVTFGRLDIDVEQETNTYSTTTKTWSKTLSMILTMFNNTIIWADTSSSSSSLKRDSTTILSGSGGFGYVGKPSSTSVYAQNGSTVYDVTSSGYSSYFTKSFSGSVKYLQGKFYTILYSTPTFKLIKMSSAGVLEWEKLFYADEDNTVPINLKMLGTYNGKFYGVSFPTSVDQTSKYYKFVLWEIDMETGNVLHTKDLPMPKAVTDGLVTANTILQYSISNFSTGIVPKNRRFAFPALVGYTKNSVFYHDWFIITVPE